MVGAIARLQRASTPSVSSEHLPASAAAALVQPWHASLTTDLIIAEAATAQRLASPDGPEVLVVGDIDALRALLDACAADTESRMERATEAAAPQLASASVHELSATLLREAQANGLAARHACRLALEAVLSCYAPSEQVKRLAEAVQSHAEGWDGAAAAAKGGRVARLLGALEGAGLRQCALNVCSVLLFTQRLPEDELRSWGQAEAAAEAGAAEAETAPEAEAEAEVEPEAEAGAETVEAAVVEAEAEAAEAEAEAAGGQGGESARQMLLPLLSWLDQGDGGDEEDEEEEQEEEAEAEAEAAEPARSSSRSASSASAARSAAYPAAARCR